LLPENLPRIPISCVFSAIAGADAESTIVAAFEYFNAHPELADVLVLTRGGGSLEDLHAFNSEDVARAVFSSKIPVVVGVGHERDESLADYVADVRASTPSNAAEIVVPDRGEIESVLDSAVRRLAAGIEGELASRNATVDRHVYRLESSVMGAVSSFKHRLRDFSSAFTGFEDRVVSFRRDFDRIRDRLPSTVSSWSVRNSERLSALTRSLNAFDPEHVLRRGYAIVRKSGKPVGTVSDISVDDIIDVRLHEGAFTAKVTDTSN
jgi:exodeoxyribonuclease VII large subunit